MSHTVNTGLKWWGHQPEDTCLSDLGKSWQSTELSKVDSLLCGQIQQLFTWNNKIGSACLATGLPEPSGYFKMVETLVEITEKTHRCPIFVDVQCMEKNLVGIK